MLTSITELKNEVTSKISYSNVLLQQVISSLSSTYQLLTNRLDKIIELITNLQYYFPLFSNGEITFTDEQMQAISDYLTYMPMGWINFWSEFNHFTLRDYIKDVSIDVVNMFNPVSDDNIDDFNAVMTSLDNDTIIGSIKQINSEYLPDIVNRLNGQNAVLVFNTAGASNSFVNIPAGKITVDLSWYLPFKPYGDMILSGFMWITFLWVLFKRFPSIIHGEAMITDTILEPPETDTSFWEHQTQKEFVNIDDNGKVSSHVTQRHYTNSYGSDVTIRQKHKVEDE